MVKMDDIRIVWILENKGLMVYLVILFWHSWGSVLFSVTLFSSLFKNKLHLKAPCVLTSAVRHGDTVCRSERWRDQEKKLSVTGRKRASVLLRTGKDDGMIYLRAGERIAITVQWSVTEAMSSLLSMIRETARRSIISTSSHCSSGCVFVSCCRTTKTQTRRDSLVHRKNRRRI